jgi:6-phosphogluconolactonase
VSVRLEVVDDPAAVCAELLVESAAAGGHVVLTGGSTPRAAYQQAAQSAGAWEQAKLWFGDERCVPPDDERSNYGMVQETLLSRIRPSEVHRIQGELGPDVAADAYEQELTQSGSPAFDLLLLGLGSDGHIASLFPNQDTLSERERLVVGVPTAGLEPFVPRVSLTLPTLASAKRIVLLVSGASKAKAVASAFGPDARPDPRVPATLLPPLARDVTVLLDSAAAGRDDTGESS